MNIQYVPYIKTFAVCITVCVSDLLHQGSGLLHFVAVSKAREEGGRIRANNTCVLYRLDVGSCRDAPSL